MCINNHLAAADGILAAIGSGHAIAGDVLDMNRTLAHSNDVLGPAALHDYAVRHVKRAVGGGDMRDGVLCGVRNAGVELDGIEVISHMRRVGRAAGVYGAAADHRFVHDDFIILH